MTKNFYYLKEILWQIRDECVEICHDVDCCSSFIQKNDEEIFNEYIKRAACFLEDKKQELLKLKFKDYSAEGEEHA